MTAIYSILNQWTGGIKLVELGMIISLIVIGIGNTFVIIMMILLETQFRFNQRLILKLVIHQLSVSSNCTYLLSLNLALQNYLLV